MPTETLSPRSEVTIRHEIQLHKAVGVLDLSVDFTLTKPWTVLFAPSGGGKTTLLRLLAGLDQPQFGRVVFRTTWPPHAEKERVLLDTEKRISMPPHRRGIGMVAQRPLLFPHRDVLANVRYGAFAGRDAGEAADAREFVEEVMTLCRVGHLREKQSRQLSGGEQQRVALARTLASYRGNSLLLLDEPFTGLETGLRTDLIGNLRVWLAARGRPVLMVTHDVGEVFATEAEVVRMDRGRVVAQGPAAEVLEEERERLREVLGRV